MSHPDLLQKIASFAPSQENWRPLDDLLGQLWTAGVTEECLPGLFGLFERYPEEDGAGVLWGIVHGLENLDVEYEPALRASMRRRASLMGRIMLDRLERARAR